MRKVSQVLEIRSSEFCFVISELLMRLTQGCLLKNLANFLFSLSNPVYCFRSIQSTGEEKFESDASAEKAEVTSAGNTTNTAAKSRREENDVDFKTKINSNKCTYRFVNIKINVAFHGASSLT